MRHRSLGRTGVMVSPLCVGTFNFPVPTPEPEAHEVIARAIAAGINFFDTADSYHEGESERILGRSLAKLGVRQRCIGIPNPTSLESAPYIGSAVGSVGACPPALMCVGEDDRRVRRR